MTGIEVSCTLDCLVLRLPADLVVGSSKTKALEVPPEFPHSLWPETDRRRADRVGILKILDASDQICLTLSGGKLINRALAFTLIPKNSSSWEGIITDFSMLMMNPRRVNK